MTAISQCWTSPRVTTPMPPTVTMGAGVGPSHTRTSLFPPFFNRWGFQWVGILSEQPRSVMRQEIVVPGCWDVVAYALLPILDSSIWWGGIFLVCLLLSASDEMGNLCGQCLLCCGVRVDTGQQGCQVQVGLRLCMLHGGGSSQGGWHSSLATIFRGIKFLHHDTPIGLGLTSRGNFARSLPPWE